MIRDQKEIFSTNLNKLVNRSNLPQREIAKNIGVSPQTFNTWTQGIAIPRMAKIQLLADYFNVEKSDLIEDKTSQIQVDISIIINDLIDRLNSDEAVTYNGEQIDKTTKELMCSSIEQAVRIATARRK